MFNIINRRTLLAYMEQYPEAATALQEWYHELAAAEFENLNALKERYNHASLVGDNRVVFNIKGNSYRLVVRMVIPYKTIQIKWFGLHKDYDKIDVLTVRYNT